MTVDERFARHACAWHVNVEHIRMTETSQLGFGTRNGRAVVLKVICRENSEEWRCGEILHAFRGEGMISAIAHEPGAVLMPRLVPGVDLVSLCVNGRDDEATEIIASLIHRMEASPVHVDDVRSVSQLHPEFDTFRDEGRGFIPATYVDRAGQLFGDLCASQRSVRLLHGDLHHYNVLFDDDARWVAIDPWGVEGETEFEVGASLRNPIDAPDLLADSRCIERRLRTFEAMLKIDVERALKWAFAMTVLCILWPTDPEVGLESRAPFSRAAHSMLRLLE